MAPAPPPPQMSPAQLAHILAHLDETRGPRIVAISILLIVTSVVAVVLRFIARSMRKLPWLIDDYFMLPALFFTVVLCVENIICVHFGNGKHVFAVELPNALKVLQGFYFLSVTYGFVHFFIKMSILLLYRRLFGKANRAFVIGLRATMIYVTAWSVATILVCIFQCNQISFFWMQAAPNPPPDGTCIRIYETTLSLNALNSVGELATLLLPVTALWKLRMSTGRKIAVAAIFMVGLFAVAAGTARIFMASNQGLDFTWDNSELVIWTAIEPAVGILCACFPVIAPLFNPSKVKSRLGSGTGNSLLRRVFRSRTSQQGKSDNIVPLSSVSSPYASAKEKAKHPFTQMSECSEQESRSVIQSNVSQTTSAGDTRQMFVPEYEADGTLSALAHETVRTRPDAEWVAKYPHRQV